MDKLPEITKITLAEPDTQVGNIKIFDTDKNILVSASISWANWFTMHWDINKNAKLKQQLFDIPNVPLICEVIQDGFASRFESWVLISKQIQRVDNKISPPKEGGGHVVRTRINGTITTPDELDSISGYKLVVNDKNWRKNGIITIDSWFGLEKM